jgi:hypothetical protein
LTWCQSWLELNGFPTEGLRSAELSGSGERLHVRAYKELRIAIKVHIDSSQFPVLSESPVPTGGLGGAFERQGKMRELIEANYLFSELVQASGVQSDAGPPLPAQILPEGLPMIGDEGEDVGWSNRELGE